MHDLNCDSPRLLLETLINWRNHPHFTLSQVRVNMFHHRSGEMAFYKVGMSSKDWASKDHYFLYSPLLKKIVGSPLMTIYFKQWFILLYTVTYNIWWEWPPLGPSDQILIESKLNSGRGHSKPYPILSGIKHMPVADTCIPHVFFSGTLTRIHVSTAILVNVSCLSLTCSYQPH